MGDAADNDIGRFRFNHSKGASGAFDWVINNVVMAELDTDGDFDPGTTETQDLGSASLEWDNLFVQNVVTVSDENRKNFLGPIENATEFLESLDPQWFTYTDGIIPEISKVEETVQVHKTVKKPVTVVKVIDGIPTKVELEIDEKVFEDVGVVDESGNKVIKDGEQVTYPVSVMVEEKQIITPFRAASTVPHSRPHTGLGAQSVKAAMTLAGYEDWAGYAYDEDSDTHMLRIMEQNAFLIKAIQELSARIKKLGG